MLLFSVFFEAFRLFAAGSDSCFNLHEYVPPSFNYHSLSLSPTFSMYGNPGTGSLERTYTGTLDSDKIESTTGSHRSYSYLNLFGRYSYYGWKGSVEWQISSDISGTGQLVYPGENRQQSYDETEVYSSNTEYRGSGTGHVSISAAHYFRWPFFIGAKIAPKVSGGGGRLNNTDKRYRQFASPLLFDTIGDYWYNSYSRNGKDHSIGCYAGIRTGAGHIDDVSFAVAALNILDRIAETEKSYKGCSASQVQQLAVLIEKMRKRRFFDSRIAFIENIDTLCAFLRESGVADEISPRSVLEIADQWNYVFYQQRAKGFFLMLNPDVEYSCRFQQTEITRSRCDQQVTKPFEFINDRENDVDGCELSTEKDNEGAKTKSLDYGLQLTARYERPLSRYFQLSLHLQADGQISRQWIRSWDTYYPRRVDYSYAYPMASTSESVSLAYYPNTRTSIKISESIGYRRTLDYFAMERTGIDADLLPSKNNFSDRQLSMSLSGNASYYFSPRLKADVNINVGWDDSYQLSYASPPWEELDYRAMSSRFFDYSLRTGLSWLLF